MKVRALVVLCCSDRYRDVYCSYFHWASTQITGFCCK